MPPKVRQQLEKELAGLNALCRSGERYTVVYQAHVRHTPAGLLRRGYYLVYRSAEGEAGADTLWWDQAGEGQFVATNARETMSYLRALIRERAAATEGDQPAVHDLSDWWQKHSKLLPRKSD